MGETVKLIIDSGFTVVFLSFIIYTLWKYVPKLLDVFIQRSKDKNYMIELLKSALDNNSMVIENNSKIIENFTKNSHKLEEEFRILQKEIHELTGKIKGA